MGSFNIIYKEVGDSNCLSAVNYDGNCDCPIMFSSKEEACDPANHSSTRRFPIYFEGTSLAIGDVLYWADSSELGTEIVDISSGSAVCDESPPTHNGGIPNGFEGGDGWLWDDTNERVIKVDGASQVDDPDGLYTCPECVSTVCLSGIEAEYNSAPLDLNGTWTQDGRYNGRELS
jgi:hypothetical protein